MIRVRAAMHLIYERLQVANNRDVSSINREGAPNVDNRNSNNRVTGRDKIAVLSRRFVP